jgi:histidinol dehydrogenase
VKIFRYPQDRSGVETFFRRGPASDPETEQAVAAVIRRVRREGDRAVAALTKQLDRAVVVPGRFEVPLSRLKAAWENLPSDLRKALRVAKSRIHEFHKRQLVSGFTYRDPLGNRMDQRVTPYRKAGIYVPGGTAAYPSTVLMNAVPARVAGVEEIIMVTPPGRLNDPGGQATLGAAWLARFDKVLAVSGAPGIAALAIGTETIPRVDIVVGPGNRFIAAAKRLLYGEVDIDMIAGPTEILVLADKTAPPRLVAADLLAQAEHDADARAVAVLIGDYDLDALRAEIREQTARAPRAEIIRKSLRAKGALVQVETRDEAVELAERQSPEHVEIMAEGARSLASRIRNVGAIFIGRHTPEPMGDYIAGPNHTLPTGGTARFFSPLSVWSFLKTSHVVEFSRNGFESLAESVLTLAETEGLSAHAQAVRERLGRARLRRKRR